MQELFINSFGKARISTIIVAFIMPFIRVIFVMLVFSVGCSVSDTWQRVMAPMKDWKITFCFRFFPSLFVFERTLDDTEFHCYGSTGKIFEQFNIFLLARLSKRSVNSKIAINDRKLFTGNLRARFLMYAS